MTRSYNFSRQSKLTLPTFGQFASFAAGVCILYITGQMIKSELYVGFVAEKNTYGLLLTKSMWGVGGAITAAAIGFWSKRAGYKSDWIFFYSHSLLFLRCHTDCIRNLVYTLN